MSQRLECPRCHRQVETHPLGRAPRRCSACGTPLVKTPAPREADVRKYLYRHRLIPLHPSIRGKKAQVR